MAVREQHPITSARPIAAGCLSALLFLAGASAYAGPDAIQSEIARLAEGAGGVTGVAAWMLDGQGPRVLLNGNEKFPMASTYKVAVAGTILAAVDAGRLKLDQMIAIDHADLVPSDVIAERLIHPGVSLSVHNLLELMLTESDNTATDALMRLAGGAPAVNDWVRRQGVTDLRVDRATAGLLRDFFGWPPGPIVDVAAAAYQSDPQLHAKGSLPNPGYDDDPRDTSTPAAMAELLTRIFSGSALSADSTRLLIETMARCRTGAARLRGRLPAGTIVAHKTGTLGGSVNDVGVITLPSGNAWLVIAVFIKKSDRPEEDRERAIAEIARSVRDYYLLRDR